jgi:prepilin peptidase CpaA
MDLFIPIAMISIAAGAAVTDARTGLIPNWLTLPPLLAAPLFHLLTQGTGGLVFSLAGALVCGILPYLLFRTGSMGGGDVKLLAALGALGGARLGLEIEIIGMCFGAVYGLLLLARRGALRKTLASSMWLAINVLLPARMRRPITPTEMVPLRLGVPLFLGTVTGLALAAGAAT